MKNYTALYTTFDEPIVSNDIDQLKEHIENSAGYGGDTENCTFKDYETAWIIEKENEIIIAQHYFSMKDKSWHRHETTNH